MRAAPQTLIQPLHRPVDSKPLTPHRHPAPATTTLIRYNTIGLIRFGKPCVAGTRITVQSALELLSEGLTFNEIVQDHYPDPKVEVTRACIRYAIALVAAEDIHLTTVPA